MPEWSIRDAWYLALSRALIRSPLGGGGVPGRSSVGNFEIVVISKAMTECVILTSVLSSCLAYDYVTASFITPIKIVPM